MFIKFKKNVPQVLSDSDALRMTEAFLAGESSQQEEQTLYNYYGGKHVAPGLECYRQMFAWFINIENVSVAKPIKKRNWRYFAIAATITALVLIGVGLVIGMTAEGPELSIDRMYAGSYIIRHGKKITDIKEILPELQRADRIVDSTLTASALNYQDNQDVLMLKEAMKNITDPDVRAMLIADLN